MLKKVNQGLLVILLGLVTVTGHMPAYAVSDEVAVQMLERLSELEQEVNSLRGENEMLRNEIDRMKSTQRSGFLGVDERMQELEQQRRANQQPPPVTINSPAGSDDTARNTPPVPDSLEGLGDDSSSAIDNIPALEDPAPLPRTDLAPDTSAPEINTQTSDTWHDVTGSEPEDRKAVAPVELLPEREQEPVDPQSPESYYYYGTEDREQDKSAAAKPEPSGTGTQQVADKPIPEAHRAKAEYNEAYKKLVNNPEAAVPAFREFLQKYPDHELAANAQYWLGEALYAQKDYSGATEEFTAVLKQHKDSPKAPGAALKLGYSFYELRQWDFARRTLEDTIRFFPDSNSAELAKNRLKKMDAEGR